MKHLTKDRNDKGQFIGTHGLSNTKIYQAWKNIKERCYTKTCKSYQSYGAKGVTLSIEWHDFETFYKYCIDNGWYDGCHISRYGDIGNYEPNNIRFVSSKDNRMEAGIRRGKNIKCVNNGKEFNSVKEAARWIKDLGLSKGTIKTISENIRCKGLKGKNSYGYQWVVIK